MNTEVDNMTEFERLAHDDAVERIETCLSEKRKELDLSNLRLSKLPIAIGGLRHLEKLYLYNNNLSNLPDSFSKLNKLSILVLNSNRFKNLPRVILSLTNLRTLSISNNFIESVGPSIFKLPKLSQLHLSHNRLRTLPSEIGASTGLIELAVSHNYLQVLPKTIGDLRNLKVLLLGSNQLSQVPAEIGNLSQLIQIDLSNNQISILPNEIGMLENLKELTIDNNLLKSLPESTGKLGELQSLCCSNNRIESFPRTFGSLRKLKVLRSSNNLITIINNEFGNLAELTELRLNSNNITELPKEIGYLQKIAVIHLGKNMLSILPSEVGALIKLETLHLDNNKLTELPMEIGKLKNVKTFVLENNFLRSLPPSIKDLTQLKELTLHGNKDLNIPVEILGPIYQESREFFPPSLPQSIIRYYFQVNSAEDRLPLDEFKLILVGRGGVGKTSLVHKLIHGEYKEFKPTDGIAIKHWPLLVQGIKLRAHVWDFGGQEMMHGTHRFFMTERALYLVIVSARENREQHDVEYWLSLIRSFAGDVPVIVLLHKKSEMLCEVDRKIIRDKYGEAIEFMETDSKLPETIIDLNAKIELMTQRLPGLRAWWPKAWHKVKTDLPEATKDYLNFGEFCEFCSSRGVPHHADQEALAQNLHALGLMLAFRNDSTLKDFGVLKPQWATNGIYKMLTSPAIKESGAKFTIADFNATLDGKTYPPAIHGFLLRLMEKFRLCFPLDKTLSRFMIPELLPADEPNLEAEFSATESLGFVFTFDRVLPQGLLPRFIVETFRYRDPAHAWRTGVVLDDDSCRAWVRGDVEGRRITVLVTGPVGRRRAMLAIIRKELRRIQANYKQLPVTEWVPIPGHPDVLVSYQRLLLAELQQPPRRTVEVEIRDRLVDWSVKDLLDGVGRIESDTQALEEKIAASNLSSYHHHHYYSLGAQPEFMEMKKTIITVGANYGQIAESMTNCSNMIQHQATEQSRDLLRELHLQVKEILESLPDEMQSEAPQIIENFEMLIKQAGNSKPNRRWYEVSAEGLIEASKFVKNFSSNITATIYELGKISWPDFSLPDNLS